MFDSFSRLHYFLFDFYGYLIIFGLSLIFLIVSLYKNFRSDNSEIIKRSKIALIFAIFIFVVFYCFAEAFFRYKYDESDALGFLKTNQRWLARHVIYNNYYVRDRNFEATKKPGVTRIGIVGDSIAFGYGINSVGDRFSNILEDKLRSAGKNVEVYNLGTPGLDTCGEVKQFDKFRSMQFDIMVWEFYPNDIQPCGDGKSTGGYILSHSDPRGPIAKFFSDKSYFFDYLYWKISATHNRVFTQLRLADLKQYNDDNVVSQERDSGAKLAKLLKGENNDRKVIGIIFPFFFLLGPNYPAGNVHKFANSLMQDNGVDKIIDIFPYVKDKDKSLLIANKFDFHPSAYVHKIAAEKLFEIILPLLK